MEIDANITEAAPESSGEEQFVPAANVETPSITALRQALVVRVAEYFIPVNLSAEFIEAWTNEMLADIERDLQRSQTGQRKYGNNFLDKDMIPALVEEIVDANHYARGYRMQKKCLRLAIS